MQPAPALDVIQVLHVAPKDIRALGGLSVAADDLTKDLWSYRTPEDYGRADWKGEEPPVESCLQIIACLIALGAKALFG